MAIVSVIISTKNEEKNIQKCLESIIGQTYPRDEMEIIVVDNNSTDRTKEIVQDYQSKILEEGLALLNLEVFNQGPERSAQKNFGIEKAQGTYFIHLDADMRLSPDVIRECVDKANADPELVALYVPEVVTGNKFFSRARNFERSFYNCTVIDGLRFFRKSKFMEAGKFDEKLYACEDWDLDKRVKKLGKVISSEAILYHDEEEFTLKKYLGKKGYYAQNIDVYINKWGKNDPDIRKQFGFYYRYLGVFMEKGKWKKFFRHPVLAVGMLALRFLVGFKFLTR